MKNDSYIETLVLNFRQEEGYLEMNLDDFKLFNEKIINKKLIKDSTLFAYFLEDRVIMSYPEKPKLIMCIHHDKKFLTRNDFDFLPNFQSYGTFEGKYSLKRFLLDEIKLNGRKLGFIFISFLLFFYYAYDAEFLRTINVLILTSITIFISIFLLFISKNDAIGNNIDLLKSSYIYKLIETDKHILSIAIFVVLLSIFNVGLTFISDKQIETFAINYQIININVTGILHITQEDLIFCKNILIAFFSSSSLILLTDCYMSIVQYYFEREKFLQLIPASKKILENEVKLYNKTKR